MAALLKKKKVKVDVADVCDTFIHHSDQFAAFVCGRGGLFVEQFSNCEKYSVVCPCGEDHVSFRSFCWDRKTVKDGSKNKLLVRGIGISCDSHGVRLFEFSASRSSSACSVIADITNNLHSVDCFNCCLQILDVVGSVVKLLAGKLFLVLHLKSSSVVIEKEVLLSECVDIADDVYVERAFILHSNVGHQGQLAMATWMSNDELYFWNVEAGAPSGFLIAVVNLQNFMHQKVINLALSEDGSRFCIAHKNGNMAVVDRNIFLYENPQRRSHAFNYSDERCFSPTVFSNSLDASHHSASYFEQHSTPLSANFRVQPGGTRYRGNDDDKLQPRISSCVDSFITDAIGSSQLRRLSYSSNASSLHKSRSQVNMSEQPPHSAPRPALSRTSSRSSDLFEVNDGLSSSQKFTFSVKMPTPGATESVQINQSRSFIFGSVFGRLSDASQGVASISNSYSSGLFKDKSTIEEVDCCWFSCPNWSTTTHVRKLTWVGTTLYVWVSTPTGSSLEQNVIIAVKFSDKKCFAFRCAEPCIPIFFLQRKDPLLMTGQSLQLLSLREIHNIKFNKLEMGDMVEIGVALCRLDDWQRSAFPLKTFEMSLWNGNLQGVESFMTSTKSAFIVENAELSASRISPSALSYTSFDERSLHSPVPVCHFYNYNDVDRFEAALHAVEWFVKNEADKSNTETVDGILKIIYQYCLDATEHLSTILDQCLPDWSCRSELADETEALLLMVFKNCWAIHNARELLSDSTSEIKILFSSVKVDLHFEEVEKKCYATILHYVEIGYIQLAESFLDSMGQDVESHMRVICLNTLNRTVSRNLAHHLSNGELDALNFLCQLEELCSTQKLPAVQASHPIQPAQRFSVWSAQVDLRRVMKSVAAIDSSFNQSSAVAFSPIHFSTLLCAELLPLWPVHWSRQQRSMILLEQIFHQSTNAMIPTDFHLEALDAWKYLCLHLLVERLLHWINCQFPSESALRISGSEDVVIVWPSSERITQEMVDFLHSIPSRPANILLDRLARSGVCSTIELANVGSLVRRLSRTLSLMAKPSPLAISSRSEGALAIVVVQQVHRYMIEYCVQHKMLEILYIYLDFWNVTLSADEISSIGLEEHALPCWLKMMTCFRRVALSSPDVQPIFDALLMAGRFVTNDSFDETTMLHNHEHILWSVCALIYKPDFLSQVLNEHSVVFQGALSSYPLLRTAFFPDARSSSKDVFTVYHLLKSESLSASSSLFDWQLTNPLADIADDDTQMPHFADPHLISRYGSAEQLDYMYYLRLGRPSYAFYAFAMQHCSSEKLSFSVRSATRACRMAHLLAIEQHHSVQIAAACVSFVKMLGHDTTSIRLHVQVANYLAGVQKEVSTGSVTQKIKLLIDSSLRNHKVSIMESASELVSSVSSDIEITKLDRCSFGAGMKWLLPTVFCRFHGLSDCKEFYTHCALRNDWFTMLLFGELFQCHPTQLLESCEHFSSRILQEHVEKAVFSALINSEPADARSAIDIVQAKPRASLLDMLFKCNTQNSYQQKRLLSLAMLTGRHFLAVLGACYPPENNVISCLVAWLVAASSAYRRHSLTFDDIDVLSDRLIEVVREIIKTDQLSIILIGFQLFIPNSHLIDFFKFCCLFMETRRVDSDCLHSFVIKSKQFTEVGGTVESDVDQRISASITSIVAMLTEHILKASNSFVIEKLLIALDEANVSSLLDKSNTIDFKHLLRLHNVTARVAVNLSCLALGRTNDLDTYNAEAHRVLENLVASHHYDTAREFALAANIDGDQVTVSELMTSLTQTRLSSTWSKEETRITFWNTCRSTLNKHFVSGEVALEFFKSQNDENKTRGEQIALLQLIYDCDTEESHIEKLDLYIAIWICRIHQNMEERFTSETKPFSRGSLLVTRNNSAKLSKAAELSPPEEQSLQELLESLLNSGQLMEAERLMNAFGRPSIPVKIITSCVRLLLGQIAVGELDADIRPLSSVFGPHKHTTATDGQSVFMLPHVGLVRGLTTAVGPERKHDSAASEATGKVPAALKLMSHCGNGRLCCRYIESLVNIARLTGLTFVKTLDEQEFDLLRRLLKTSDASRFSLARDFVAIAGISDARLSTFMCCVILESLQVHEDKFPAVGVERGEKPILLLPKRLCSVDTRKTSGIIELIQLFANASVLGYQLVELIRSLDLMMKDTSIKLLTVQVILLTFANDCFMLAASTSGIASILAMVKRVVLKLFETLQYDLIVHLLTSIGQYSEMNYVFDGLKQHGQFDLLFADDLLNEERFRLALLDFMHRFHPDDTATRQRVAQHFGMYQELAKITELSACARLEKLGTSKLTSKSAVPTLKAALEEYVSAAELYAKAKCSFEVLACMSRIRLLTLQFRLLKSSSLRVVNLSIDEAVAFVRACGSFTDARIVQDVYELPVVWADILFEKVVKNGMLKYAEEMAACKQLTSDILNSVVRKYAALRPSELVPSVFANMKCMMSNWTSVTAKHQVAKQLGFDDIVQQIETDEYLSSCLV